MANIRIYNAGDKQIKDNKNRHRFKNDIHVVKPVLRDRPREA